MKNILLILFLMGLSALPATSQSQILRASKTMDYNFEGCSALQILGEKATIKITGKDQQKIELKVTLVAKHKDQETALNDLKHIRFLSQKEGTKLILKNFYETTNRKIESNLSIVYELIVPEALSVQLQNLYGSVTLLNLSGLKTIDVSFGRLDLQNIAGNSQVQLKYCDLTAKEVTGKFNGFMSKSDALISNCSASVNLNLSYGNFKANLLKDCESVNITANRTEIELQTTSADYNLDLKTTNSTVQVFGKTANQQYRSDVKSSKNIIITTSYCPIKINLK